MSDDEERKTADGISTSTPRRASATASPVAMRRETPGASPIDMVLILTDSRLAMDQDALRRYACQRLIRRIGELQMAIAHFHTSLNAVSVALRSLDTISDTAPKADTPAE